MSNFITTFKRGKLGKNLGRTTGIKALDKAINGLQKKISIGLAASPKCGKTALSDFCFFLSPYLEAIEKGTLDKINWIYFSYEVDRISKEFKFASFFFAYDFQIYNVTYKGVLYPMCQDYLMGKLIHYNTDDTREFVPMQEDHELILKDIYSKRIVPIFGEYADDGVTQITPGKITFIEDPENPTGVYKYLMHYGSEHGTFKHKDFTYIDEKGNKETGKKIIGYVENDEELMTVIIVDHVRKFKKERGFVTKEIIDKWLEYSTWLRNICHFTFINIVHSGRQLANVERLKFAKEFIYPTADDTKDTGNIAEESTILMTLFNPNDEKYNMTRHFGVELESYPNYRSIHISESRYTECPVHIQCNMYGGINIFTPLNP